MSYLSELITAAQTLPAGVVYVARTLHDPDCPKLRGRGCTCSAEIEIQRVTEQPR